jgi:hypothetical protein
MGVTYRAIQAIAPGKLQTVELPVVEPPTGHVRVRIEAYGNMPILTGAPRRDHEQNGETMNQTDWVRPSWKTMLIGLALTAGGALSVVTEPATAPHGAMPMQEQQQRLAQGRAVGLREALTKDASFWARLMPSPL